MSVSLTIRIADDDKKRLAEIAAARDRSIAYVTNEAIKEYLAKHPADSDDKKAD